MMNIEGKVAYQKMDTVRWGYLIIDMWEDLFDNGLE